MEKGETRCEIKEMGGQQDPGSVLGLNVALSWLPSQEVCVVALASFFR